MPEADRAAALEACRRIHAESWLKIVIEGASAAQIAAAEQAVREVFQRHGVSALQAAEGQWALEGLDARGFPEGEMLTEAEAAGLDAWDDAMEAAGRAAFGPDDAPGAYHRIGFELQYPAAEYEAALDVLFPERARVDAEEEARVVAGLRAQGSDPDALGPLPF